MAPSTSSGDGSSSKKRQQKERLSTCSYCPMTFKKLEHAQRHERTHTLDRPYSCETCGKTFARQDTLHRHTRLHLRADDEGPTAKGPKKRRASTSSGAKPVVAAAVSNSPKPSTSSSERSNSGSSASSSSKVLPPPSPQSIAVNPESSDVVGSFSSSSAAFGLSMSLPVHPPSFPVYGHSERNSTLDSHFSTVGNSNSIDPSVLPLHSSLGDARYGGRLHTRRASYGGAIGGGGGGGQLHHDESTTVSGVVVSRPRALTLAGLPESLGCFSLINSPASSAASLSLVEDDEDDDEDSTMDDDEDVDDEKNDPSWIAADSPSFPAPPESHYPSPAFSSYSPSALHNDSLGELQAILDNDPIPSSSFKANQMKAAQQASHLASVPEPDFDFEAFAASIEGGGPPSGAFVPPSMSNISNMPASLDELLGSAPSKHDQAGFSRYPTPPSDSATNLPLPTANDYDWLNQYTTNVEAQHQAREDAAVTAAMFSRGFGLDSTTTPSSSTSALGLSLGLPSPPLTAMAMHSHTSSSSSHLGYSMSKPPPTSSAGIFENLHASYAATYPTFSLSMPTSSSIVPSPIQATPVSNPHVSIPSQAALVAAATSTSSPSLHDLLAAAWERRQRGSNSPPFSNPITSSSSTNSTIRHLPSSINLSSPFPQPPPSTSSKQIPGFYIPSTLHSSPSQIGTATNSDSLTVSASGPLSLAIPSWASVPTTIS